MNNSTGHRAYISILFTLYLYLHYDKYLLSYTWNDVEYDIMYNKIFVFSTHILYVSFRRTK